MRRAIARFPLPEMAQRVIQRYFVRGGKPGDVPFKLSPLPDHQENAALTELTVVANFAEVYLAKQGHHGVVGINYLEKVQIPFLPSLMGAMLAGVDYVLMVAGIPRHIPGALDAFAMGKAFELKLDVGGALAQDAFCTRFDPAELFVSAPPRMARPKFFPIVASATLAMTLAQEQRNGRWLRRRRADVRRAQRAAAWNHAVVTPGRAPLWTAR